MPNNEITLSGTNETDDKFSITLTLAGNKWIKSEPGGASKVLTTTNGVWSRAIDIVALYKPDGTSKVATLNPLVPESAKSGDIGGGSAAETASILSWKVTSVA